jgi:hypothetical protein
MSPIDMQAVTHAAKIIVELCGAVYALFLAVVAFAIFRVKR